MRKEDGDYELGEPTRRALLSATAAGASSLIAGCSSGNDDDSATTTMTETTTGGGGETQTTQQTTTQEELVHVSDQTLTWYTMRDVSSMTWLDMASSPTNTGDYVGWASFSTPYQLTMQPEIRLGRMGEPQLETYESVDITSSEVTVKIRDDAKWSNGDQITAPDVIASVLAFRMIGTISSFEEVRQKDPSDLIGFFEAITDYQIVDEKTLKLNSPDAFGVFEKEDIYGWLTLGAPWGGARGNTNLEPYDDWWNAIEDFWDQAKNGEIDPWGGDFSIKTALSEVVFGPHGWSRDSEKNDYNQYWEKYYQKPENVVTTGAWTPKSINGTKNITLEPNEHHRHYDEVNFDEIKIVARKSGRAARSALKANSQDYYRGSIPEYIADSFPDDIEQRLQPNNGGLAFAIDHQSSLFDDPRVRQAVMHAIDTERLAKNVHQSKFAPVTTPGAHAWGAKEVLGDEWIADNLTTYEQRNRDRAAELMKEAGYHKEGGKWLDEDGNEATITVPTASQTPQLEPAFASQLSEFGIDASLQTYGGSVFNEKRDNGEFTIWPTDRGVGFDGKLASLYRGFVVRKSWAKNIFRVFPEEQIKETEYLDSGLLTPETPEGYGKYSLKAPPVGEPNGELKTWKAPKIAFSAMTMSDDDRYQEALRKLAWLYNWHMPVLPIAGGQTQHFLDTGHWNWPSSDSTDWELAGNQPEYLVPFGRFVQADSENPEEGATVEQ